ncbi:hypothetical protein [Pseudoroseicyclus aestuarii]|uniref:ATP-dependent protease ClpP protease subunit n=1 Tax=Pseudoroseicyclus aestuarii TaxID=1795041 RepID=A0A318SZJ1_9RHOB|nr:hypothetical protein [Pseudoroseicyclus aestuarii]PYE85846.1 hypothetical protein DFP88_101519 [Pseudoroseicyclus aestuarii]
MTAQAAAPRPKPGRTRRWLMAVLGLEGALALVLFASDMRLALPRLGLPSSAPALTQPVAPGDQTRRYSPRQLERPASPGQPMPSTGPMPERLAFEREGTVLTLTGSIAPGDAQRLAEALERAEEAPQVVQLNSPGGSVTDALEIGRALREAGAETRMTEGAICLSACPYVFAAGTERRVAEGAMVGVHQHYFGESPAMPLFAAVSDIQRGQAEVMGYLIEMGVDPALMQPAMETPPDEIYLLLPEELERFRLVTPEAEEA